MLNDLFKFINDVVVNWSATQIAVLILGFVLGVLALACLGRLIGFFIFPRTLRELERERDQFQRENQSLRENLQEERGKHRTILGLFEQAKQEWDARRTDLGEDKHQLGHQCERLRAEAVRWRRDYNELLKKAKIVVRWRREQGKQLEQINEQIRAIMELDGQFWQKAPTAAPPLFRTRDERRAPIIAVFNLKGGVGKTTLTANLGAKLWARGLRVLQVDLDHQGTLTSLCLTEIQEQDNRRGEGKLVNHVLKASARLDHAVWQNLIPFQRDGRSSVASYLLPANKHLADVEEDRKARWLLRESERDVRFLLREALHGPLLQQAIDVVLLDCPPRLTTGCINALACADFVLVPVLLDKPSTDALPNLLGWLRILKERDVCPYVSLLGIVGNRTHYPDKLTSREKTLWLNMRQLCQEAWKEPVYFFARTIPSKPQFADAAQRRTFAALDPVLEPIFGELVQELFARKVFDENQRFAVVSA